MVKTSSGHNFTFAQHPPCFLLSRVVGVLSGEAQLLSTVGIYFFFLCAWGVKYYGKARKRDILCFMFRFLFPRKGVQNFFIKTACV
jgi:hypothetical protein